MISAHWEAEPIAITAGHAPALICDYYRFPPHTYEIEWPATGYYDVVGKATDLIKAAGIEAVLNTDRGFDHGVFIPLKVALSNTGIPTIELSLNPNLDPTLHIEIGEALESLREQEIRPGARFFSSVYADKENVGTGKENRFASLLNQFCRFGL